MMPPPVLQVMSCVMFFIQKFYSKNKYSAPLRLHSFCLQTSKEDRKCQETSAQPDPKSKEDPDKKKVDYSHIMRVPVVDSCSM